jgi:NADPH2:quinone reductase
MELGAYATVVLDGDVGAMAARMGEASRGKVDVIIDLLWGLPAVAALLVASPNAGLVAVGVEAGLEVNLSSAILLIPQTSILGLFNETVPHAVKQEAYAIIADHARKGKMTIPTEVFRSRIFGPRGTAWGSLLM